MTVIRFNWGMINYMLIMHFKKSDDPTATHMGVLLCSYLKYHPAAYLLLHTRTTMSMTNEFRYDND